MLTMICLIIIQISPEIVQLVMIFSIFIVLCVLVENMNLTYSIPFGYNSKFSVNPVTGDLVTNVSLDQELTDTYTFAGIVDYSRFNHHFIIAW